MWKSLSVTGFSLFLAIVAVSFAEEPWVLKLLALIAVVMMIVGLTGGALSYLFYPKERGRLKRLDEFEEPNGWSMTFSSGTLIRPIAGGAEWLQGIHHTALISDAFFQNLSKNYSRTIGVYLKFKDFYDDNNDLILETTNDWKSVNTSLQFPLNVGPGELIDGEVAFSIPPEARERFNRDFQYTYDWNETEFYCVEKSSNTQRKIYLGEQYDAYDGDRRNKRISSKAERMRLRGIRYQQNLLNKSSPLRKVVDYVRDKFD